MLRCDTSRGLSPRISQDRSLRRTVAQTHAFAKHPLTSFGTGRHVHIWRSPLRGMDCIQPRKDGPFAVRGIYTPPMTGPAISGMLSIQPLVDRLGGDHEPDIPHGQSVPGATASRVWASKGRRGPAAEGALGAATRDLGVCGSSVDRPLALQTGHRHRNHGQILAHLSTPDDTVVVTRAWPGPRPFLVRFLIPTSRARCQAFTPIPPLSPRPQPVWVGSSVP